MNKWGRMLQKELDKNYSEKMQNLLQWYPDVETDETYQWVFKLDEDSNDKHRWTLNKYTREITKTIQKNQF